MDTSNTPTPTAYGLRELIVHAREGSPIALAAVVSFVQKRIPQVSPQLILSFAERILETCNGTCAQTTENAEKTAKGRLKPWPRNNQGEPSAASPSKLDSATPTVDKCGQKSSPVACREMRTAISRVSS